MNTANLSWLTAVLLICTQALHAQAVLNATDSTGGAYAVITAADFGIEGPDDSSTDCRNGGPGNHSAFGDHVLQAADAELDQNVFVFVSHIAEDNDRCRVFDRARMEIKGGPAGNTDEELEHVYGDTSYYRWQFRLAEDFVGASSFTHLFQNKAAGGSDVSFPVLTLTARATRLEVKHSAGDDNPGGTRGVVATASLTNFRGKWVEVFIRQVHTNNGQLRVTIADVASGSPILNYENNDIDLFRGNAGEGRINRPKWGIYRSYNEAAGLRDEEVRFANFCSSEQAAELCPSIIDLPGGEPTAATGLLPLNGSLNVPTYMPLVWKVVTGAASYNVYFGTAPSPPLVTNLAGTTYTPMLAPNTTYYFQIGSVNANGESRSGVQQFTTLTNPDDGNWEVARGHARPEVEAAQFFEFNTNLAEVGLDSVGPNTAETGNNAYCFFSGPKEGSNGNYRWRYRQVGGEETTLVLRLRALPETNNITYIEFYGLGWRQKIRINRSGFKFEKAPGDPEYMFPAGYWDDGVYHTVRVTFANDPAGGPLITTAYLDEHAFPIGSYPCDEENGGNFLDVGRAGGTNYGACYDYIAINPTGVFAPGAGPASIPPADLELPEPTVSTTSWTGTKPSLYPNPVQQQLHLVDLPTDQAVDYRVFSVMGKELLRGNLTASGSSITVNSLPRGTYFLQLKTQDGEQLMARFVKQ